MCRTWDLDAELIDISQSRCLVVYISFKSMSNYRIILHLTQSSQRSHANPVQVKTQPYLSYVGSEFIVYGWWIKKWTVVMSV